MKFKLLVFSFLVFVIAYYWSKEGIIQSPNQKISVQLFNKQSNDIGEWYVKAFYNNNEIITEVIPRIELGLSRSGQDFSKELKVLKAGKPNLINEEYTALHGKKSVCQNSGNEVVVFF